MLTKAQQHNVMLLLWKVRTARRTGRSTDGLTDGHAVISNQHGEPLRYCDRDRESIKPSKHVLC